MSAKEIKEIKLYKDYINSFEDNIIKVSKTNIVKNIWTLNNENLFIKNDNVINKQISEVFSQDIYLKIRLCLQNGNENETLPIHINEKWIIDKVYNKGKFYFLRLKKNDDYYKKNITKEEMFNALLEGNSSGIEIYSVKNNGKTSKDFILKDINEKSLNRFNKIKNKILGKSIFDIVKDIDKTELIDVFKRVYKTGEKEYIPPIKFRNKEWFENNIFKLPTGEIVVSFNEVTDFMELNKELESSKLKLDEYISKSPYGIFVANEQGVYIEINNKGMELLGYKKEELINHKLFEFIAIENYEIARNHFKKIIEKGYANANIKLITKNRGIRDFSIYAIKLNNNMAMAYVNDITEKVALEKNLLESENRYKELYMQAPLGHQSLNIDGYIIDVNPMWLKLLGYNKNEVIGQWFGDFLKEKDKSVFEKNFVKLKSFGFSDSVYEMIKKNGDIKHIKLYSKVTRDSNYNFLQTHSILEDITEQKKAEEVIKSQVSFLDGIMMQSPHAMWISDNLGTVINVNKSLLEMFGVTQEQIENQYNVFKDINLIELGVMPKVRRVFENLELMEFVIKWKGNKAGDEIFKGANDVWIQVYYFPILNPKGKLKNVVCQMVNVSDAKIAEIKLKESEKILQITENIAHVGSYKYDFQEKSSIWSDEIFRILGYEIGSIEPDLKIIDHTIFSEDKKKYDEECKKALKNRHGLNLETRIKKHTGEVIWIELKSTVETNEEEQITQIVGVIIDINERKKYEENIISNLRKLQQSEELINLGYFEKNWITEEYYWSDGYYRILGLDPNQYIERKTIIRYTVEEDKDELYQYTQSRIKAKKPLDYIFRVKIDNKIKHIHQIAEHYYDKKGKLLKTIGIIQDITEKIALEKEREKLEIKLSEQQKLEAIGILASGVAHEINNPINGIMNYGQIILDDENVNRNIKGYANEIIGESKRISEIVKNLLQFSRHEKQHHSLARIEDIINQTLVLIKTVIKKDNIVINLDIQKELPSIKCRSQQIQQVVLNLLINARDAINEKKGDSDKELEEEEILVSAKLILIDNIKWIRVSVKDKGIGIGDESKDKVFNPFYTTKPKYQGTGLGLAISYGIIKEHQGVLDFKTKEGEGTEFYFDLLTSG